MRKFRCHKGCLFVCVCIILRLALLWNIGFIWTMHSNEEINLMPSEHLVLASAPRVFDKRNDMTAMNSLSQVQRNKHISYKQREIINIQHSSPLKLLLYSALVTNSSDRSTWDQVFLQGWSTPVSSEGHKFDFCVLYSSGIFKPYLDVEVKRWKPSVDIEYEAIQIHCNLSADSKFDVPLKATVRAAEGNIRLPCPTSNDEYVDIEFVYRRKGIAAFIKTLYSNLSHVDMLSWFEIHRKLGIGKVYGYVTHDLNNPARVVLGHYQRLGLFEPISYPLPGKVSVMYQNSKQCFNFQGVSNYDSQIRLQGYDYLMNIDSDEYLIPARKNESIKDLFDRLFTTYPNAAGFIFRTYLLIKDWGAETNSPFSVERFLHRSNPCGFSAKHVVRPSRVVLGDVYSHKFKAKKDYKRYQVNTTDVAIYHYRSCREHWLKNKPQFCLNMTRTRDTSVFDLFQTIKKNTDFYHAINGL